MIVVTLGNNVNVEQFQKFAWLYRDVINCYKLFEYHLDIQYYLPKPETTLQGMTIHASKISIGSIILDYARLVNKIESFSKTQYYVVTHIVDIYNKYSLNKFNYNLTKNDMNTLNKINKLLKLSK